MTLALCSSKTHFKKANRIAVFFYQTCLLQRQTRIPPSLTESPPKRMLTQHLPWMWAVLQIGKDQSWTPESQQTPLRRLSWRTFQTRSRGELQRPTVVMTLMIWMSWLHRFRGTEFHKLARERFGAGRLTNARISFFLQRSGAVDN